MAGRERGGGEETEAGCCLGPTTHRKLKYIWCRELDTWLNLNFIIIRVEKLQYNGVNWILSEGFESQSHTIGELIIEATHRVSLSKSANELLRLSVYT
jgi:hypothetical protein